MDFPYAPSLGSTIPSLGSLDSFLLSFLLLAAKSWMVSPRDGEGKEEESKGESKIHGSLRLMNRRAMQS